MYDIVIIGSGLGGLLCGYMLSREGFRVCILEKEPMPGGNLLTFHRHGHEFETGIHYVGALGEGQTLRRYWDYTGLTSKVRFSRLDPDGFDRIALGDQEYPLAQGFENFTEQLSGTNSANRKALISYTETLQSIASAFPLYNLALPGQQSGEPYISSSAVEYLEANFPYPLSTVLAGNNFLYGGSRKTPLSIHGLINHSFITGAWRIIGGSGVIAESLAGSIREQGGTIFIKQKATSISSKSGTFHISCSSGETFVAGKLISDIHPAATVKMMEPGMIRESSRIRLTGLENTASPFVLFLTLKKQAFPYLNYNHYQHAEARCWEEAAASGSAWPRMYMLSTGCQQEGQQWAETLSVLTYMRFNEVSRWESCNGGPRAEGYGEFKLERASRLLQMVSRRFPGLTAAIEFMDIATPLTWAGYTGTPGGSMYGIQRDFMHPLQTMIMARTKTPGFYFTGQNTNLHGALGVTVGAVKTCGEIVGLDYLLNKIRND